MRLLKGSLALQKTRPIFSGDEIAVASIERNFGFLGHCLLQ